MQKAGNRSQAGPATEFKTRLFPNTTFSGLSIDNPTIFKLSLEVQFTGIFRTKRLFMKTTSAKNSEVDRKWHVIDADRKVVGRLASRVASILRGKNKPIFTPHVDTGDYVVIVNAGKVRFTGNKLEQKVYYHHTGFIGGIKMKTAKDIMKETPERIILSAVRGMLPKNRLGRQIFKKLKVYRGPDHPHQAQNPEMLNLDR